MPTHHMITRIEKILEKANGITFKNEGDDEKDSRTKDKKLIDSINQFGWAGGGGK